MAMGNDDRTTQLSEFEDRGRGLLAAQARRIDELIGALDSLDPDQKNKALRIPILMMQAVGVSFHSVLALTSDQSMTIRDCFGISRSAVETAINAAFIGVSPVQIAEKADRHNRQKRWRDLDRTARVGSLQMRAYREIESRPEDFAGLPEALEEFTDQKGREKRDWIETSLDDRITEVGKVSKQAGLMLASAKFAIYRHSSELLHGTWFGVNHFWQGSRSSPARSAHEFVELWVTEHFVTVVGTLIMSSNGAVEVLATFHDLRSQVDAQKPILDDFARLIDDLSASDPEPDDEHKLGLK